MLSHISHISCDITYLDLTNEHSLDLSSNFSQFTTDIVNRSGISSELIDNAEIYIQIRVEKVLIPFSKEIFRQIKTVPFIKLNSLKIKFVVVSLESFLFPLESNKNEQIESKIEPAQHEIQKSNETLKNLIKPEEDDSFMLCDSLDQIKAVEDSQRTIKEENNISFPQKFEKSEIDPQIIPQVAQKGPSINQLMSDLESLDISHIQPKLPEKELKKKEFKSGIPKNFNKDKIGWKNYIKSDKIQAVTKFDEKTGLTGTLDSGTTYKVNLIIENIGSEKLDKTFSLRKVIGNCSPSMKLLPVIVPNKSKKMKLEVVFESEIDQDEALYCLSWEENSRAWYFGDIIRIEYKKGRNSLKMNIINEIATKKILDKYSSKTSKAVNDEAEYVKNVLKNSAYIKQFPHNIFSIFKQMSAKWPELSKHKVCKCLMDSKFTDSKVLWNILEKNFEVRNILKGNYN